MVRVSPLGFGSVPHSLHTRTGLRYLSFHSVAWTGLAAHTHRQACSPPWRLYSLSLIVSFSASCSSFSTSNACDECVIQVAQTLMIASRSLSFIDWLSLSLQWHRYSVVVVLFEFGWCCWFWVWGSYRSISCSSFNVACLRERDHSLPSISSHRVSLCVSWNAMTWGDLSQCRHQQQPPAPRGVVEITRLSPTWWAVSLSCEWVSGAQRPWLILLAWLISTSPQRRYLIIIMMTLGWRSWGLVGSLGWSMKTSNIKWCWGLVLAHTHTHYWFVFSESKSSNNNNNNNINITSTKQIKPTTTTTKYKCRPSLVHSHSSLISSSIINNHQQLVWNDDTLSFELLGVWVWLEGIDEQVEPIKDRILGDDDDDWLWLPMLMMANVFQQQKQEQQTSKTLACKSVTNSHHWLKHSISYSSLSLSISLFDTVTYRRERKMMMMITNIKLISISLVSVIVLVPSTRFKQ